MKSRRTQAMTAFFLRTELPWLSRMTPPHLFAPPTFREIELAKIVEQAAPVGLDLAAQRDELRAVAAQEAVLLLSRRRFADDPASPHVAMHESFADQPGQRRRIARVGFAPAG